MFRVDYDPDMELTLFSRVRLPRMRWAQIRTQIERACRVGPDRMSIVGIGDGASSVGFGWSVRFGLSLGFALSVSVADGVPLATAEPVGDSVDFMRDVRPILAQNCFVCHGPDEGTREGGFRLDKREGLFAELASGERSIVAEDPDASELLARVKASDPFDRMPPPESGKALSDEEIGRLEAWIEQGASYAEHWSFQPPRWSEPPPVIDQAWPRDPIDQFVLAKLDAEGIRPSPQADRRTLIRRLSLDLTGLLPSPAEVEAFVEDDRPGAYERLADRLLLSPHFGERWGRHWLDLARYADSDGYLGDDLRPGAYRYRDWVIDAINRDLPFDRFTVEQIAGDLLPDATPDQRVATGFHRNTMKNTEAGADREEDRVNRTVDRVATTGTVWLGLTLGCAECHTHKFDPISHREFYQLYAFFNGVEDKEVDKAQTLISTTEPRETRIHLRGDFRNPGDRVEPNTLGVLPPMRPRGSVPDRLDFASWLVDDANPLTPRTAVNHVWKHLFGRGLVATPDDFGTTGETPSHPELLDRLAIEFRDGGWSRKALIKRIVMSATYRQESHTRPDLASRDPFNTWLARQGRFRLEAEIIRDVALTASGLMERSIGGPSVRPPMQSQITAISRNKDWKVSPGGEKHRRGLYILFRRATPYPMLTTFDAPDSTVACARRERSNSPLQSLTLLNDPVFVEAAQRLGDRLVTASDGDAGHAVRHAYRVCLAREPTDDEFSRAVRFVEEQRARFEQADPGRLASVVGEPDPGIDLALQAAQVALARVILNLDEFITRE